MLDDGRSVIQTMGSRRFQVKKHWMKDGYVVANVAWVEDEQLKPDDAEKINSIIAKLKAMIYGWLSLLSNVKRDSFYSMYGNVPDDATKFSYWCVTVMPLPDHSKWTMLKITSLRERLDRILQFAEAFH